MDGTGLVDAAVGEGMYSTAISNDDRVQRNTLGRKRSQNAKGS